MNELYLLLHVLFLLHCIIVITGKVVNFTDTVAIMNYEIARSAKKS